MQLDPFGCPLEDGDFLDLVPSYDWRRCVQQLRLRYSNRLRAYGAADAMTNARVKRYLYKDVLQVANMDLFSTGDWENIKGKKRGYDVPPKGEAIDPDRSKDESKRRAKSKVRDIALCNKFDYMFTWTLDPKKVDRTDPEEVYKKARSFLTNKTTRNGFVYVLIPEYHKLKPGEEKPGIHFHGLCKLGSVRIERSLKKNHPRFDKSGRPVFNMVDWKFGWSTVVPLDANYERAVNYITKYISKQDEKILGKYYLSSRCLKKSPDIEPIALGVPYDSFVDDSKLASGEQYKSNPFFDVVVVSQDFDSGGVV